MTLTLVNNGQADAALNRNAVSGWVMLADSKQTPIAEITLTDILYAAPPPSPLRIPRGGSEVMRVFRAKVTNGHWDEFGGAGLVMHRDCGDSCYPLASVPGEYYISGHLLIRDPEARPKPAGELVSDKVKLTVSKELGIRYGW